MLIGNKPIGTVAYMGGVPAVLEQFSWSWGQMIQYNAEVLCEEGQYIHYDRTKFSYHSTARNDLVKKMYGDWIVMLDTDHEFEPDIIHRLLYRANKYNLDVLSGLYRFKNSPYTPVAFALNPHSNDRLQPIAKIADDVDLVEISAVGAGCLFVRRKIFDIIKDKLKEDPFSQIGGLSEDHSFFKRLRDLNIKAYLSQNVEAFHLKIVPITKKYETDNWGILSEPINIEGYK